MKKVLPFVIPLLVCLALGFIASRLQADSIENWYPYLEKPALTPPDIVFPIAWNIIYVCISISLGLILISPSAKKQSLCILFAVQLLFNFCWSVSFFYLQSPLMGFINILILDALVLWYAIIAYPVRKASSILFWPYILWLCFATYLNLYILLNN